MAIALLLTLAAVVAAFIVARLLRARRAGEKRRASVVTARPPTPPVPSAPRPATTAQGGSRPAPVASSLAVASTPATPSPRLACPACRREYEATVRFCPYDSRRLVPASELPLRARAGGAICPRCRRTYEAGARVCQHDGEELMPAPLWSAPRGRRIDAPPTGVMAKICPRCSGRYDLSTTFCGKDGAELMTIN